MTLVSGCPAVNHRDVCAYHHTVDMSSRIYIIQRIEDDTEAGEEIEIELGFLDVGMVVFYLDIFVIEL